MALKDKSLYPDQTPDTEKMYGLFDSGKMGMIVTGPWQLSDITDHKVSYGVQLLPAYGTSHETISGPDVYMVFNHSDDRRKAAATFLAWLHEPAQDLQWDVGSGNLPLSAKTAALPALQGLRREVSGRRPVRQEPRQRAPHPPAGARSTRRSRRRSARPSRPRCSAAGVRRTRLARRPRPPTKPCPEPWRRLHAGVRGRRPGGARCPRT